MKGARKRPPARVNEPLSALLAHLDPQGRMNVYRVWDFWDDVVGAAIAERAQPQRVQESVLVVQVANHAWMQELQFLKDDIRARLNQRIGTPLLSDLRFVLGRAQKKRAVAPAAPPPIPVAVPDLPSTGSSELDDILRRIATAAARRQAALAAPKKRKRRKGMRTED